MSLTADKTIDRADTHWFNANPDRNFRVRNPRAGEVEELARKALPPGATLTGELPTPSDDVEWAVFVVKVDRKTTLRLLTLKNVGYEAAEPPIAIYAVSIGHKVAVDTTRKF